MLNSKFCVYTSVILLIILLNTADANLFDNLRFKPSLEKIDQLTEKNVIDWFHEEHPNTFCQKALNNEGAYWNVNQLGACTNNIECGIANSYYRIQIDVKPRKSAQCGFGGPVYYGCYEGRCTRLDDTTGLPPNTGFRQYLTRVG